MEILGKYNEHFRKILQNFRENTEIFLKILEKF